LFPLQRFRRNSSKQGTGRVGRQETYIFLAAQEDGLLFEVFEGCVVGADQFHDVPIGVQLKVQLT
jgi:hypothetical protein